MNCNVKYLALVVPLWLISFVSVADTQNATLNVQNMSCATCPVVVRGVLLKMEGVDDVVVSMKDKTVVVTFDNGMVSTQDLVNVVSNSGFPAKLLKSQ